MCSYLMTQRRAARTEEQIAAEREKDKAVLYIYSFDSHLILLFPFIISIFIWISVHQRKAKRRDARNSNETHDVEKAVVEVLFIPFLSLFI